MITMNTDNVGQPPASTGGGEAFDMSDAVMKELESRPWEAAEAQQADVGGESRIATDTDPLADLPGGDDGGAGSGADDDPFDFTKAEEQEQSQDEKDDGEYVLELGESFKGSDEVRGMITQHAKAAGLDAGAAGKFVAAVCESLAAGVREQRLAGFESLKKEWGRNFSENMAGTKVVLNELLKSGVIDAGQVEEFKSPAVFKTVNYLRSKLGEKGTAGMRETRDAGRATELKDILENSDNAMNAILMNPMHPKYAATAEYVNGLAGMRLF